MERRQTLTFDAKPVFLTFLPGFHFIFRHFFLYFILVSCIRFPSDWYLFILVFIYNMSMQGGVNVFKQIDHHHMSLTKHNNQCRVGFIGWFNSYFLFTAHIQVIWYKKVLQWSLNKYYLRFQGKFPQKGISFYWQFFGPYGPPSMLIGSHRAQG